MNGTINWQLSLHSTIIVCLNRVVVGIEQSHFNEIVHRKLNFQLIVILYKFNEGASDWLLSVV